jgi:hypothetical protein
VGIDVAHTRGQWLRVERFGVATLRVVGIDAGHTRGQWLRVERVGVATINLLESQVDSPARGQWLRVKRFVVLHTRRQWLRVERHGPEDCKQRRESSTLFIHAKVHDQGNGKSCGLHCNDRLVSLLGNGREDWR